MNLPYRLTHPSATPPAYSRPGDAGLDLSCVSPVTIHPGEVQTVPLGVAVAIPAGFVGLLLGRSGLASKGLMAHVGTIDPQFRGELAVVLANVSVTEDPVSFAADSRIAQLVIVPCVQCQPVAVDDLGATDRGERGFGSSGV